MAVGELGVLPAVRAAPEGALLVADGFSCREQIAQGTGRPALHVAEVLDLAARERRAAPPLPPLPTRTRLARVAIPIALGALAAAALVASYRRRIP